MSSYNKNYILVLFENYQFMFDFKFLLKVKNKKLFQIIQKIISSTAKLN